MLAVGFVHQCQPDLSSSSHASKTLDSIYCATILFGDISSTSFLVIALLLSA
jgi:hypothetical protein